MDQTQNMPQQGPFDLDAVGEATFESEEIERFYQDGLLGRAEAEIYDLLFAAGFAQDQEKDKGGQRP